MEIPNFFAPLFFFVFLFYPRNTFFAPKDYTK